MAADVHDLRTCHGKHILCVTPKPDNLSSCKLACTCAAQAVCRDTVLMYLVVGSPLSDVSCSNAHDLLLLLLNNVSCNSREVLY